MYDYTDYEYEIFYVTEYKILKSLLLAKGPLTRKEIARRVDASIKTIAKCLVVLEDEGYVEQTYQNWDSAKSRKRTYYYTLTDEKKVISDRFSSITPTDKGKAFEDLTSPQELLTYLRERVGRMKKHETLSHYTTVDVAEKILCDKKLMLTKHNIQNDDFETNHFQTAEWDKIYSASFTANNRESHAMWKVYSKKDIQKGIRIDINAQLFKNWISSINNIYLAKKKIPVHRNCKMIGHYVAYSEARDNNKGQHCIKCGEQKLHWDLYEYNYNMLAGYIKHDFWSLEEEIRISAFFKDVQTENMIYIDIPEEIVNSCTFVTNPWFNEQNNFVKKMRKNGRLEQSEVHGMVDSLLK